VTCKAVAVGARAVDVTTVAEVAMVADADLPPAPGSLASRRKKDRPVRSIVKQGIGAVLRIAVADDEPDMQEYFEKILPRLGHEVVSVAENGRQLVEHCRELQPDLVITDIKMPEMDGIEAAEAIFHDRAVPVILVSAHHDTHLIDRAESNHILAYLVKPIKQADLEPAISIAVRRFRQFQAVHQEAASLRQALEDRKIIERAKGILMKRANLDESEAFRRLQKLASEKNMKLIEIAGSIVTAEEAFRR
jgi:response regulator NasT